MVPFNQGDTTEEQLTIEHPPVSALDAMQNTMLDAYFEAGLNPWDCAAGLVIAGEAGASLSGLRGRPAGGDFTLAAAPSLADDLVALLERVDADEVL